MGSMRGGGAAAAEAWWSHPEGEEWSVFYAHPATAQLGEVWPLTLTLTLGLTLTRALTITPSPSPNPDQSPNQP